MAFVSCTIFWLINQLNYCSMIKAINKLFLNVENLENTVTWALHKSSRRRWISTKVNGETLGKGMGETESFYLLYKDNNNEH